MARALAAYRHILRSTRVAFQGDTATLNAARERARQGFEKSRLLSLESEEASKQILMAEDVARILRENVVQGTAQADTGRFKLRMHDEIERGDNESVKIPRAASRKGGSSGGCCQDA